MFLFVNSQLRNNVNESEKMLSQRKYREIGRGCGRICWLILWIYFIWCSLSNTLRRYWIFFFLLHLFRKENWQQWQSVFCQSQYTNHSVGRSQEPGVRNQLELHVSLELKCNKVVRLRPRKCCPQLKHGLSYTKFC